MGTVNRQREGGADVSPGLPPDGGHVPRADVQRLTDWEARWARCHHELLPGSHWYTEMLCVDPDVPGDGLGAVLTCHGLARADPTGTPTFLEADSAGNATMYAELGFELNEHGHDDRLALRPGGWSTAHREPTPEAPRREAQSRQRRLDLEADDG